MISLIWVFIGGGLGSLCRFGLSQAIQGDMIFPWATIAANMLASFILGMLFVLLNENDLPRSYALLLMTGFCGGFSTFSTFSLESYNLMESGQYLLAALNMFGSLIAGVLFVFLGIRVGLSLV